MYGIINIIPRIPSARQLYVEPISCKFQKIGISIILLKKKKFILYSSARNYLTSLESQRQTPKPNVFPLQMGIVQVICILGKTMFSHKVTINH